MLSNVTLVWSDGFASGDAILCTFENRCSGRERLLYCRSLSLSHTQRHCCLSGHWSVWSPLARGPPSPTLPPPRVASLVTQERVLFIPSLSTLRRSVREPRPSGSSSSLLPHRSLGPPADHWPVDRSVLCFLVNDLPSGNAVGFREKGN